MIKGEHAVVEHKTKIQLPKKTVNPKMKHHATIEMLWAE